MDNRGETTDEQLGERTTIRVGIKDNWGVTTSWTTNLEEVGDESKGAPGGGDVSSLYHQHHLATVNNHAAAAVINAAATVNNVAATVVNGVATVVNDVATVVNAATGAVFNAAAAVVNDAATVINDATDIVIYHAAAATAVINVVGMVGAADPPPCTKYSIDNKPFCTCNKTARATVGNHEKKPVNLFLKKPKCEIFNRFDFRYFPTIKALSVGDFKAKILIFF